MFSDGFTDLRLNHPHGEGDDSFWPSFTDIMTVIVMIFLLSMVVVMMRNSELIHQLRATMEAERQAAELARATSEEKESLASRLIDIEHTLSMLRMEMMHVKEQRDTARKSLKQRDQELLVARSEQQATLTSLKTTQSELEQKSRSLQQVTQQRKSLSEQIDDLQLSLQSLQKDFQKQTQQLQAVSFQADISAKNLVSLEGEYDELKTKYDKLVRPARTAKGKYVVEIRKARIDGKMTLGIKLPSEKVFAEINETALHARLAELKKKYANILYIKIIFPEDSGLSYNEAWGFTSELHKKYDYYYQ